MNKKMINKYILGAMVLAPSTMIINNNYEVSAASPYTLSAATSAVEAAELNPTTATLQTARELVNGLPESSEKDNLQGRLNALTNLSDLSLNRGSASANVDVYIKCENMISFSLSTNSITFENFGAVEDQEELNAVTLTVNSSLPYDVNAYLPVEIEGVEGNTLDKDIFQIRANGESAYQTFSTVGESEPDKITLLSGQPSRQENNHGIDINLKGGLAHEKDIYKATVKFEISQN